MSIVMTRRGRYENDTSATRLTMAEIVHEVVRQTDGLFALADFGPISCSNPNGFGMAVAFVRDGYVQPRAPRVVGTASSLHSMSVAPRPSRFVTGH